MISPFTLEYKKIGVRDMNGKPANLFLPESEIIDAVSRYNKVYYTQLQRTWGNTFYHGVLTCQSVADLWVYQELIFAMNPDLIIETGTGFGGCTLYFAHILDNMKSDGKIISIDILERERKKHKRITYLTGSSLNRSIVSTVRKAAKSAREVLVFLDSNHSTEFVYKEMETYGKFVRPKGYMVVEDTNCVGPGTALDEFVKNHREFEVDPNCNKFYQTFCPGGFLQRKEGK